MRVQRRLSAKVEFSERCARHPIPLIRSAACGALLAAFGLPALADPGAGVDPPALGAASARCQVRQHWDPGMAMCMPGAATQASAFGFRLNQFALYSSTWGPRGRSRVTGPGLWMLTYDRDLAPGNHVSIDLMASPEPLTVGSAGTPQLLQTEHVDSMHAHDTIMAFEFRDAVTIGDGQPVTFLFAPRGHAAAGPVPFMHRESAEGNPDAPLGHTLQDGFHDVSTVLGLSFPVGRMTLEATAFSGRDIRRPFPLHRPDSYAVRIGREFGGHIGVGASYADALLPTDAGGAEHDQFASAWLTTSHRLGANSLKSAFVWGRASAPKGPPRDSLLEEAVYQRGADKLYDRAEVLQIAPQQLDLTGAAGAADPKWVEALTVGYERTLLDKGDVSLFLGGSYTRDWVPASFQPAYGSRPGGVKVYLRVAYTAGGLDH